jgi:hypothetical protein
MTTASQQIADLVAESLRLHNLVDKQIESENSFRNSLQASAQTIRVGPDKDYPDILSAVNSLNGRVISGTVFIRVDDGVYNTSGFIIENQPYSTRIRIIGNVANPAACIIRMVPDVNGNSSGVVVRGSTTSISFSGFTIEGNGTTARGLAAADGASLLCDAGTIVITGCNNGIEAFNGSFVRADGVIISDVITGVITTSICDVSGATITGRSESIGSGVVAVNNGLVLADRCTVLNFFNGFIAQAGGNVESRFSTATGCRHGFRGTTNATLLANDTVAIACTTGYLASSSGYILAFDSRAENCTSIGWQATVASVIEANNATFIGNATNFGLASGVAGNGNSTIFF